MPCCCSRTGKKKLRNRELKADRTRSDKKLENISGKVSWSPICRRDWHVEKTCIRCFSAFQGPEKLGPKCAFSIHLTEKIDGVYGDLISFLCRLYAMPPFTPSKSPRSLKSQWRPLGSVRWTFPNMWCIVISLHMWHVSLNLTDVSFISSPWQAAGKACVDYFSGKFQGTLRRDDGRRTPGTWSSKDCQRLGEIQRKHGARTQAGT